MKLCHAWLFVVLFLVACSDPPSHSAPGSAPQRIITFTPSLTEAVFALGLGDRIVGTTEWCNYPPEAKQKEKLGGIGTPSYERIVALKPDLFVISAALGGIAESVEKLGIPALRVPCDTIEDVDRGIDQLGRALDRHEQAKQLLASINKRLHSIEEKIKTVKPRSVLLVIERQPETVLDLSVVGSKNVIDSLITLAGGRNVFHDSTFAYPKANQEEILARDPEVILDFSVHGYSAQGDDEMEKKTWSKLGTLRAVRENQVHIMPKDFDLYPGPRIADIVERFAKILHPELFP